MVMISEAARVSPWSARSIRRLSMARCLLTVRRSPPSRSTIRSCSSSARSVLRFLAPFGRPFGLPDCPGLNWVCLGGLLWPTS